MSGVPVPVILALSQKGYIAPPLAVADVDDLFGQKIPKKLGNLGFQGGKKGLVC